MTSTVMIPAEKLKTGLTEQQFRDMLEKRGLTPAKFVSIVQTESRRSARDEEVGNVLRALEDAADIHITNQSKEAAP